MAFLKTKQFVARLAAALVALAMLMSLMPLNTRANVFLAYLRGVTSSNQIVIEWGTATEANNAGFYVLRFDPTIQDFRRLNSNIIPGEGNPSEGADYSYTDLNVTYGVEYAYQLEAIDIYLGSQFFGPISVIAGMTPTPSPTSLPGAPTRVPTSTSTRTLTPTRTSTPPGAPQPTATATPLYTNTPGPSPTRTRTATPGIPEPLKPTSTPVPPGMVPIVTATAAAQATAHTLETAAAARPGVVATPVPGVASTATAITQLAPGGVNATRMVTVSPTRLAFAATTAAKLNLTATRPAIADASPPGGAGSGSITGTNWLIVGLAIGLIAVAIVLILGAIFLIRLLLSR